jgi:hypothetical protein
MSCAARPRRIALARLDLRFGRSTEGFVIMSCRLRQQSGRRSWNHARDKRAAGARTGCADGRLTAPRLRVRQLPMNKRTLPTSYRSSLSRVEIAAIRTFPAHVFFCSLLRFRLSKRLAYFQQKSWGILFLGISGSSDNFGVEMRLPSWTCRLANGVGKDGGADEGSQRWPQERWRLLTRQKLDVAKLEAAAKG